jgi:hypothetical protein
MILKLSINEAKLNNNVTNLAIKPNEIKKTICQKDTLTFNGT